jgi:lipid A 4'-phosphatase
MNRAGLLVALAVAAVAGLVFGLFPQLDIAISQFFIPPGDSGFAQAGATIDVLRAASKWMTTALVLPAFIAGAAKLILPRWPMLMPARPAIFLIATLALAPGLFANVFLKDHWGRSRPYAVAEFGGPEKFSAWWDPRGDCSGNCSFVSGEASGAFWTLAPAALAPPAWRPLAYGASIAFGAGVGIMRIAFGAHFFSDVVFAGVFTFLIIWAVHGLLYRWPRTRVGDAALEARLGRLTAPIYDFFAKRAGQKKRS